jgi:cysteine desulfurase/selenocysteine lyase
MTGVAQAIDVERVRADTPGCEQRLHFNNAGASLMPRPVFDAVTDYLDLEARIGGYEARDLADGRIENVYAAAASLIGCQPSEIALLENATRAWNAIFYSIPFRRGDRILTGRAEYVSNFLAYLKVRRTAGVEIVVVDDDERGQIDVERLAGAVDERTRLITLTHVPTSGGLVNPAADVGSVARAAGVPFLLDACQSVGQMPIDVKQIGCDFLSTTGRKFLRGPRGTGFVYVSSERLEQLDPAMPEVGSAAWTSLDSYTHKVGARRLETWEASFACQLGLGAAIDYALEVGLEPIWQRVQSLAADLREQLLAIDGVQVHDQGLVRCGIVTFTGDGVESQWLFHALRNRDVNVHVSEPGDTRLDFEARALRPMIRASIHYFNTEEEVTTFCELVEELTGDDK